MKKYYHAESPIDKRKKSLIKRLNRNGGIVKANEIREFLGKNIKEECPDCEEPLESFVDGYLNDFKNDMEGLIIFYVCSSKCNLKIYSIYWG